MKDIVEFYNIVSPLVLPERFCLDTDLITTDKVHPSCPTNPKKSKIVAGIKRHEGKLEPFLTKDYKKPFDINNLIIFLMLFLIVIYTLNKK
tara:strand:+ start:540 stop:812 length:273 start_codon:yes stop_codon:yes gene_type:complete